jgi:hypothetical protein
MMVNSRQQAKKHMGTITLTESQDPIAALAGLRGPVDVRAFLNLSLGQIVLGITDTTARIPHPVHRSLYFYWEKGTRTPTIEQVRQIERLIEKALHAELAYDVMLDESLCKFVIRITVGRSRWYVRAYTACAKCKRMYNISRIASKRCKRCITKSKR